MKKQRFMSVWWKVIFIKGRLWLPYQGDGSFEDSDFVIFTSEYCAVVVDSVSSEMSTVLNITKPNVILVCTLKHGGSPSIKYVQLK